MLLHKTSKSEHRFLGLADELTQFRTQGKALNFNASSQIAVNSGIELRFPTVGSVVGRTGIVLSIKELLKLCDYIVHVYGLVGF